jgi:hypothetical protein
MPIYIGTPIVTIEMWNRKEIDKIDLRLYRKITRIGNDTRSALILNTITTIRLAGEIKHYLSRDAQN